MKNRRKSIRTQFMTLSVLVIMVTLIAVGGILSLVVVNLEKSNYYDNSLEQMKIAETAINIFYNQIDKDINMMATNPLVMKADKNTVTSYANTSTEVLITASKNGGLEQQIFEVFDHYAKTHPGTMYVYFGTADGSYLQWPETKMPARFIPAEKGWYQVAINENGNIIRTAPYLDGIGGGIITSNVKAFTDASGKVIGVLGIDVQQSVISDMLNKMKTGKTGYSMIVHNTGVIMADGNNPENNFKNLEETGINGLDKLLSDNLKPFNIEINGTAYMVNPYKVEGTDWILASFLTEKEIYEGAIGIFKIILIISIISIALTSIIMAISTKKITNPIIRSMQYLNDIAKGDFTQEIDSKYLKRKDEIGSMTNAINDMKDSLKKLIHSILKESSAIEGEVELTVSNVIKLNDNIEDITAATEELAANMEETAASSEEISATSQEIQKAAHFIAEKSQEGALSAGEITARADKTRNDVTEARKKAYEIIVNTKQKVENAIEDSKVVNQINILTQSIMDITAQTNLLSLNASIEAARAGEAGRGFSVVADEIGKLADQSKVTAIKIQDLIEKVTGSVSNLSTSSNELLQFVSEDVTNDYEVILDVAGQYNDDAKYVNELVTDFSSTAEQLLASIDNILAAIDGVAIASNEGASGTTEIATKSSNMSIQSSEVKTNIMNTRESAVKLKKEIAKFKI